MDPIQSLPFILLTALIASMSPGPATLAISSTAMSQGVAPALKLATGILCGSFFWSISAALGLGAVMLNHAWIVEIVRYAGALYLFWLAFKSLRAAWRGQVASAAEVGQKHMLLKGFLLHVTNPKAIFFFGALYALMLAPGQSPWSLAVVVLAIGLQSAVVFLGYAVLFSRKGPVAFYKRSARWVHGLSGLAFGAFGAKLLTAKIAS